MKVSSLIYRLISEKSPLAASHFLSGFNHYKENRGTIFKTDFEMVNSYLIHHLSFEGQSAEHELRCLCGNKNNQRHWMDDFHSVILPRLVSSFNTVNVLKVNHSLATRNTETELGELLLNF